MSNIVFSTDFSTGFTAGNQADATWHHITTVHAGNTVGCSGGPVAWWANRGVNQRVISLTHRLASNATALTACAIRFRMAVFDPYDNDADWSLNDENLLLQTNLTSAQSVPQAYGWAGYSLYTLPPRTLAGGETVDQFPHTSQLFVRRDGSLKFVFGGGYWGGDDQTTTTSAPGIVPFDGQFHGYQVLLNYPAIGQAAGKVYFDNALILQDTHTFSVNGDFLWLDDWGWTIRYVDPIQEDYVRVRGCYAFSLFGWRGPYCGSVDSMNAFSTVEVEDAYVTADYTGCTAPGLSTDAFWKAAVVTGLGRVVADNKLIIYGTDFVEDAYIEVQNPYAVVETFTVESVTATQIVLANLNPPMLSSGTYCVTVTNPCV